MSFLRRLFGPRGESSTSLSDAECEFLARLGRGDTLGSLQGVWSPIVGSLERKVDRFLEDGLLEDVSISERLCCVYGVAELKELLKEKGVKPKGKKSDLIDALIVALGAENISELVKHVQLYRLTEPGQEQLDAFEKRKTIERARMEELALLSLVKGDMKRAAEIVSQHEAGKVFQRGMSTGAAGGGFRFFEADLQAALFLVKYEYEDLPLSPDRRRRVGAALALSKLLGESTFDAGRRLLELAEGEFRCPSLSGPLMDSRCRVESYEIDPDMPQEIAELQAPELYARTRLFEANSYCQLRELKTDRTGRGVSILPHDEQACTICLGGRLDYSWSEIGKLPRLPRDWGCGCSYLAWIPDIDAEIRGLFD